MGIIKYGLCIGLGVMIGRYACNGSAHLERAKDITRAGVLIKGIKNAFTDAAEQTKDTTKSGAKSMQETIAELEDIVDNVDGDDRLRSLEEKGWTILEGVPAQEEMISAQPGMVIDPDNRIIYNPPELRHF